MGCNLNGETTRYTKFAGSDLNGVELTSIDLWIMDLQGVKILESRMRQLLENSELIIFPDQC